MHPTVLWTISSISEKPFLKINCNISILIDSMHPTKATLLQDICAKEHPNKNPMGIKEKTFIAISIVKSCLL